MWQGIDSDAFDLLLNADGVEPTGAGKSNRGIRWSQFANADRSIMLRIEVREKNAKSLYRWVEVGS